MWLANIDVYFFLSLITVEASSFCFTSKSQQSWTVSLLSVLYHYSFFFSLPAEEVMTICFFVILRHSSAWLYLGIVLYCHVLGIPIFILCVWLDDGDEFNRGMHSHYFAYLSPPCLNPCIFVLFSLFLLPNLLLMLT